MNCYLVDEKEVSKEDIEIREKLYHEFRQLPVEFVSKMRYLQPQVGCFNNCSFCSKSAVCKVEYWSLRTLRNVICALKNTARHYTKDDLLLAWNRQEHRVGVIFPYINTDIASYPYLEEYLDLCYRELGVRTRISTVGFSRHNETLNRVHKNICSKDLLYTLAGVCLSITQYGRVWEEASEDNSLEDYAKDIGNFLNIYKPYFEKFGSGPRRMCVELRYNPLVINATVLRFRYHDREVIATNNYLFISKRENIILEESFITDPYDHSLSISNKGEIFTEYNLPFSVSNEKDLITYLDENQLVEEKEVEVYLFHNRDGEYYAIDPKLTETGNYGMTIYPITEVRKKSGYFILERFFLNALYNFKKKRGYELKDCIPNTSFSDIGEVIRILREYSNYYEEVGKQEKSEYIRRHILPVIEVYVEALKIAGYSSDVFFDKDFTIDTGAICNLGRAINLFKGLTNYINEPLTPIHERNYGRYCSTMKQENSVWLLGCDYQDSLLIEKLNLFNTASTEGQVSFKKRILLEHSNKIVSEEEYLYPGSIK